MTDKPSRLSTPLDFDAPGKHCDYVRLPHSVHRSAYGWLPIPIVCINNGEGPTVLLMSGTHGDEYEGQVALTKLIRLLEPEDINGRLIIQSEPGVSGRSRWGTNHADRLLHRDHSDGNGGLRSGPAQRGFLTALPAQRHRLGRH